MKIFLTIFLLSLLVAVSYETGMGVDNPKGIQETEEIKGVNAKIPHGRHKRWWGGYYGGGCCGGGWGW